MSTSNRPPASSPLAAARKPRRWRAFILGLVIFIAGGVCGAAVVFMTAVHRIQYAIHHPEEAPRRIAAHLKRTLKLDEEQAKQVQAIIAKRQTVLMALRREVQPRVEKELDQITREIAGVLHGDQSEKWQKMVKKVRDEWLPPFPATLPATTAPTTGPERG